MAFVPKQHPAGSRIHAVTLGTGARAVTIGGQNVLPFHSFDAPIPNPPRIGVEISDCADRWDLPGLRAFYDGCRTMADYAARAEAAAGADFLALRFESADPSGQNRSVEACVRDAEAVAAACGLPLVILGCQNTTKDAQLFAGIARALTGRGILLLSARAENFQSVSTAAAAGGHCVGAETADDVTLAKQLNIMLRGLGVPADQIVMNIGTAAVGYGYEYVVSTYDRVRLAALEQADEDLQMPILSPLSLDTWTVKEAVASEADEPDWGDREERGIQMEIATAAADLAAGADAVILRHIASVETIRAMIDALI